MIRTEWSLETAAVVFRTLMAADWYVTMDGSQLMST